MSRPRSPTVADGLVAVVILGLWLLAIAAMIVRML